jgi:ABC-type multidrug transport system ATPase subunit
VGIDSVEQVSDVPEETDLSFDDPRRDARSGPTARVAPENVEGTQEPHATPETGPGRTPARRVPSTKATTARTAPARSTGKSAAAKPVTARPPHGTGTTAHDGTTTPAAGKAAGRAKAAGVAKAPAAGKAAGTAKSPASSRSAGSAAAKTSSGGTAARSPRAPRSGAIAAKRIAKTAEPPLADAQAEPATEPALEAAVEEGPTTRAAPEPALDPAPVPTPLIEPEDPAEQAIPAAPAEEAIDAVARPEDPPAPGAQDEPRPDAFLTPTLTVQSAPLSPRPQPRRRSDIPQAPRREVGDVVLSLRGVSKRFGENIAVDDLDLEVREGSFYGIVGPNGAGKTTTLSMITGLLRPDAGSISVHGIDVWRDPVKAKRTIGVLPDALRLFDRLTGAQLLYYSGTLRGLDHETVRQRSADLVAAFGIEDAVDRLVTDYSAGMTKKIALAAAMIHSPRLLVLDEPFESVDPVSAANLNEILQKYVASGGTVVLSSHGMDFIQRVCDHVAIIVAGRVLSAGTMDEVRGTKTLEDRFVELAGGRKAAEGMEWLHSFTD